MRRYIRHPSDIPIEFSVAETSKGERDELINISYGGLSFQSHMPLDHGAIMDIKISLVQPPLEARVQVKWCRKHGDIYDIGVSFIDLEEAYRTRMVEQICHIEHYKREVLEKEGRELSGEQAAMEWISRFAETFPELDMEQSRN